MYVKLGRMMGRSYEDTLQILLKTLRNAESQLRIQIMITLEMVSIMLKLMKFMIFDNFYTVNYTLVFFINVFVTTYREDKFNNYLFDSLIKKNPKYNFSNCVTIITIS